MEVARLDGRATYRKAYERSLREPDEFWAEQAESLDWMERPSLIRDVSFEPGELRIRWFGDGVLNACVNCVDRHLHDGARPAIIWEATIRRRAARSATPNFTQRSAAWQTV